MLYNTDNQLVTLTREEMKLCETDGGNRQRILKLLKEIKQQSDPNGRSTSGMFSLESRAVFK